MKIVYTASEAMPFVKTGGLSDVAGSLPKELAKVKGNEVRVVLPLYSAISSVWRQQMTHKGSFFVSLGWRNQYCGVFELEQDGVVYTFLDNEYYFMRNQIYGEYDDAERFAFFSKAVLEWIAFAGFCPDVLHANDWQTALVITYLNLDYRKKDFYAGIKTVYTIHNIQYQGRFGEDILEKVFGIDKREYDSGYMVQNGDVNLMKAAIMGTDAVTTVSCTYADEIKTPYYAYGLDGAIRLNEGKLHAILNGIDCDVYNPATDPHVFANYTVGTLAKKEINKQELMRLCGLELDERTPVIGIVSRLVSHKGMDLIEAAIDEILWEDVRLVVLGTGEWRYEQMFEQAKRRYPSKISTHFVFSHDLAHKIYAGADLLLMPSHSEPCGLAQMIAMRYGTVPIVRETGGLKDTVSLYVAATEEGNGFAFANYNAHDMMHVIKQAYELYQNEPKKWENLVKKNMKMDFSWKKSAKEYQILYASIQA